MSISPKAATEDASNGAEVPVSMFVFFVAIKQFFRFLVRLHVCTNLNSNPKSPDRQEIGKEVVLGA